MYLIGILPRSEVIFAALLFQEVLWRSGPARSQSIGSQSVRCPPGGLHQESANCSDAVPSYQSSDQSYTIWPFCCSISPESRFGIMRVPLPPTHSIQRSACQIIVSTYHQQRQKIELEYQTVYGYIRYMLPLLC